MFALKAQSAAGRLRKKSGDHAERVVEAHLNNLARIGIAFLRKLPTPYRVVRSLGGAEFKGCFTEASPHDYFGYTSQGRFVAVEVKRISSPSLKNGGWSAIRFDLDALPEHQRAALASCCRCEGWAFVVVVAYQGLQHRLFAVPWARIAQAIDDERASLSEVELAPFEVERGRWLLEAELGVKL